MAIQPTQAGAQIEPRDGTSYVRGSTDIPLSDATVSRFFLGTVAQFPDRPAVTFREQNIRWTWREFADEVDVLASGLLALGVEAGDRVGIWSPNRSEWLLTQFATARIGAVLVNINPAYRLAELEYALNKVGCKALIAAEQFKTSKYLEMLQTLAPELADAEPNALHAARLPELRTVIRMGDAKTPGMLNFGEVMARGREQLDTGDTAKLDALEATLDARDAINIQFTSGTTGNPKGATLTHHNVVNNARYIAMAMRLSENDSLCIPVPLYHCFGMVLAVLACVSTGCAMVFPGEAFDPAATLAAVHEERCTALHGVPTMFIAELDHPDFAKYDSEPAAHGHHGRLAVPDRDDEARRVDDESAGDHDRLRDDGNQPGVVPERDDGPARQAHHDGRPHSTASRSEGHRSARRVGAGRRDGRTVHARLLRDEGLLGR